MVLGTSLPVTSPAEPVMYKAPAGNAMPLPLCRFWAGPAQIPELKRKTFYKWPEYKHKHHFLWLKNNDFRGASCHQK
jgi:hypothetical protein